MECEEAIDVMDFPCRQTGERRPSSQGSGNRPNLIACLQLPNGVGQIALGLEIKIRIKGSSFLF